MDTTSTQKIEISVLGKDLSFSPERQDYNRYINAISPKDKIAPSHNFLVSVVDDSCKAELMEILHNSPGSEIELAGVVIENYVPDLAIVVKKRKTSLTKSLETATTN